MNGASMHKLLTVSMPNLPHSSQQPLQLQPLPLRQEIPIRELHSMHGYMCCNSEESSNKHGMEYTGKSPDHLHANSAMNTDLKHHGLHRL